MTWRMRDTIELMTIMIEVLDDYSEYSSSTYISNSFSEDETFRSSQSVCLIDLMQSRIKRS